MKGHDVYEMDRSKFRVDNNEELWQLQKEVREKFESELGIELRVQPQIKVKGAFGVVKKQM